MSFNKRFFPVGGIVASSEAACTTDTADVFGDSSGVALYTLDYDASEASGQFDGTPTDVEFGVGGQINYGARFNGSSSGIQINTLSGFTNYNFSLSFWLKRSATSSYEYVMSFRDPIYMEFGLNIFSGNTTGFGIYDGTTTYFSNHASLQNIDDDNWHHIVGTHDGTNLKIYLDGSLIDTVATGTTTQSSGGVNKNQIGQRGDGTNTYVYAGNLDQVRIFNRALNSTEVSTLYAETACVYTCTTDTVDYPTTNVAYYKLDNNATDETGSYDGTENNISYTFGRFGQAADFSGSISYINTGYTRSGNEFALSAWVYASDTGLRQYLFADYDSGGADTQFSFACFIDTSDNINVKLGDGSSSQASIQTSFLGYYSKWTHIVLSIASDGKTPTLYLDNNQTTGTTVSNVYQTGQNPIGLGHWGGSPSSANEFTGLMDQVRIFSSALDSTQVTQLYEEKPCADTSTFKTVLYEGNSSTQYISSVGFEPDLVWVKSRSSSSYDHNLYDSVRGVLKRLKSNATSAEDSNGKLSSFDANGFSLTSGGDANTSGQSMVAWVWKAGGDAVNIAVNSITGSTPSVASDVSANQDAGFSIVKYNKSSGSTATIGHGLSSAPEMIIVKTLDVADTWRVYHSAIGATKFINLNDANAAATASSVWNDTAPTSSVFSLGTDGSVGNGNMIAYCFHSVSGVSKVGSYTGDGTDDFSKEITGLGFDPSFVMVKNTTSSGSNWEMIDVRRGDGQNLYANENYSENANSPTSYGTGNLITDGFAVRRGTVSTSVHWNKSGDTFIYLAFA